jgi:polyisoprenoid-binding protein YceI
MKRIISLLALSLLAAPSFAQKMGTRSGQISFFSHTPVEDISAKNNDAAVVVDSRSGDVAIAVPIRSFRFEKQLMEEHFNENYMESAKYPKAEFKGRITNANEVQWTKDGSYPVKVLGNMTMHGVTREVSIPATIVVAGGKAAAQAKFPLRLADYKIEIPSMVASKISESVTVSVNVPMQSLAR